MRTYFKNPRSSVFSKSRNSTLKVSSVMVAIIEIVFGIHSLITLGPLIIRLKSTPWYESVAFLRTSLIQWCISGGPQGFLLKATNLVRHPWGYHIVSKDRSCCQSLLRSCPLILTRMVARRVAQHTTCNLSRIVWFERMYSQTRYWGCQTYYLGLLRHF